VKYDPIKNILGTIVRKNPWLRKVFYSGLGLMFLREWHVKRALRAIIAENTVSTMFDAGSGFGQYSYFCAKKFPHLSILAVDVKTDQIEDCARFFGESGLSRVRFSIEDLTEPLHSDEFDLILSVDVMEHIADDMTVFRNFHRALRTGGILVVNTPSSLGGSDAQTPDDKSFIEEHARTGYGQEEIRTKMESSGFAVEQLHFTYGRWGTIAWRLGIKFPMLMLNRSHLMFLFLPLYYLFTLPFTLLFMYLDYRGHNQTGTGLLVIARKV